MLRRTPRFAFLASLAGLTACSLYFGEKGEEDGGGEVAADASVVVFPDAAPDPEACEVAEEDAVAGLSGCMSYEDWEAAGLCDLALMRTGEGACYTCHTSGMDGITLETDCAATFEAMKTWPRQNDLVIPRTGDGGCFAGFDVGLVCGGEGLPADHAPFVCPNSLAETLDTYIQSNYGAWQANTCP